MHNDWPVACLDEFSSHIREGLSQADWATRREIIRTLVERICLESDQVRIIYRLSFPLFARQSSKEKILHFFGGVISRLLSNIYLDPLDHRMAAFGFQMVRYADDFVVFCRSRQEAQAALEVIRQWVAEAGLMLHPEKTHIADANQKGEGFDFLGYHFEREYRWPRRKSLQKLKTTLCAKTRRTNGRSLNVIIADLNRTLQGCFGYFRHSSYTMFEPIDQWVRMRLRSILCKRQKKRGRGRGSDHQRWPNAYFASFGLYTLKAAHAFVSQASPR